MNNKDATFEKERNRFTYNCAELYVVCLVFLTVINWDGIGTGSILMSLGFLFLFYRVAVCRFYFLLSYDHEKCILLDPIRRKREVHVSDVVCYSINMNPIAFFQKDLTYIAIKQKYFFPLVIFSDPSRGFQHFLHQQGIERTLTSFRL